MNTHEFLTGTAFGACCLATILGADASRADEKLWDRLAEGGKVVLMRHGAVNTGYGYGNPLQRDESCRRERNLSSEGRHQAKSIGEQFRARRIPIEAVLHSPFCRTSETAKLAFPQRQASAADYLYLLEVLSAGDAAARTAQLSETIGSYSGAGNLILITHEPNLNAITFETTRHGDFLVLQPKGRREFEELGLIRWQ